MIEAAGLRAELEADAFWMVKATSAVSEWPELWNAGQATSIEAGKAEAEAALRSAAAHYGTEGQL